MREHGARRSGVTSDWEATSEGLVGVDSVLADSEVLEQSQDTQHIEGRRTSGSEKKQRGENSLHDVVGADSTWADPSAGLLGTYCISAPTDVGVVVRGFPPLCKFSRQSDS